MDFYLRRSDGSTTGPYRRSWLQNQISTGGATPEDQFAAVATGEAPTDEYFQPATLPNLKAIAERETPAAHGSASGTSVNARVPGGFLRIAGLIIACVGTLAALFGAIGSASSYDTELDLALAISGVMESVFYGGLLWAAGTGVGLLEEIRRQI